jgi:predicted ATP-grasp superfamily ATP-dependent carboligase
LHGGGSLPGSPRPAGRLGSILEPASQGSVAKVVLLPTSDLFFLFLSRHCAQLADKFLMNLPSEDLAESVVNKRRLYELAAANDTPFPTSYFPGTYDEALAVKDSLRYPAFIKPYWGHK